MATHFQRAQAALFLIAWLAAFHCGGAWARAGEAIPDPLLSSDAFKGYVEQFNQNDQELYPQHVPNAAAWAFLSTNVPRFECPDAEIERTYYFRWWTYRKHIKQTPDGFVITEFLPPVPWAGKHNTIDCAAGHHLYEGRWLHNPKFLDDYSQFWFRKGGNPQAYSFWAADAIYARLLVTGDSRQAIDLLPDLVANYERWEKGWLGDNGLFWQNDGNDGMEVSIGGSGYRATINTYLFGDALAIAQIATLAGNADLSTHFKEKARSLKHAVQTKLWDSSAEFFKVLPRETNAALAEVRELHGFTPWYCNLPDPEFAVAWKQLLDPRGFLAPFGPTTAEQRHPRFAVSYEGHECQWNGPSWPYSTAVTLTAMANLINNGDQEVVHRSDYFNLLKTYAHSHQLRRDDGSVVPWIDENLNPFTGDWIARTRLKTWSHGTWDSGKGGVERGKDYNHSTFCDLVIGGLVGLRPSLGDQFTVNPLVPEATWDYFCVDNLLYHGRTLAIWYDRTGSRYGKGKGLFVRADGQTIASRSDLGRLTAKLEPQSPPTAEVETSGGWKKFQSNPVLGGKLGTCFDVSLLKEQNSFRMWFSWRPKASVALVESPDGVHWSQPEIVLGPNPTTRWEKDINRPVVIRHGQGYQMWYTGQSAGQSWIGYAMSPDGRSWTRKSEEPVVSPEKPWENAAVMCPDVMWDEKEQVYRMWYSGGEQYEPNAIGYATSLDGLRWNKHPENPTFRPASDSPWERERVTACHVVRQGDWYVMFYIGFRDVDHAQIGVARSRNGINGWERHRANPIIRPGEMKWDHDATYKPYAILDGGHWMLWYNGRHGQMEQVGLATHDGADLKFED